MGIFSSMINAQMQRDTNETNLQIARETNQSNLNLAREQNQWNIDQWNRENAYNDPAAQAQRLRNAGLSAAAAAQQVNGGQASHLESATLANQQAAKIDAPRTDFNLAQDALNIATALSGTAGALKQFKELQFTEDQIMTNLDVQRWSINEAMQRYTQSADKHPHNLRLLSAQAGSAEWREKADSYLPEFNRIGLKAQKMNFLQSKFVFEHVNPMTISELGAKINLLTQQYHNAVKTGEGIDLENQGKALDNQGKALDNYSKSMDNAFKEAGMPESNAQRISALVCKGILAPKNAVSLVKTGYNYVRSAGKVFNINPGLMPFYTMIVNPGYGEFMKMNPKIYSGLVAPYLLDELTGFDTYSGGRYMSPAQKSKIDFLKATGQHTMGMHDFRDDEEKAWDEAVGR